MENETEKKIEEILTAGNISPEDRKMWLSRLAESDGSFGEMFVAVFEDEPELLRFATVDIKSRILARGNPDELEKLRVREKEYFQSISEKES